MQIPSEYREGYNKARQINPALADKYIRYSMVGDPIADAAIASLAEHPSESVHRMIRAGMENRKESPPTPELRNFFDSVETPPPWYRPETAYPGCLGFHNNSDLLILSFVANSIVIGFSSLISKSFLVTGRTIEHGVRRLRQNLRHLIDITLPGGLERGGEGWKLTVRIRLIHAQIRHLLKNSGDWDADVYGAPLHAAHIGMATASFSALLLNGAIRMGAGLTPKQRAGYMHIWRYTGYLMGAPEELLFQEEDDAMDLVRVGLACDPPPGIDAIIMAHTIINSAPLVAGIADEEERRRLAQQGYRISRALIGNGMADNLEFPKSPTFGVLTSLRWKRRMERTMRCLPLGRARNKFRADRFLSLLSISALEDREISYRLPVRVYSEQDRPW